MSEEWVRYYAEADARFRAGGEGKNSDAEIARRIESDQRMMPTVGLVVLILTTVIFLLFR